MQVVLHSDDINLLSYWQEVIEKECKIIDSLEELQLVRSSLVVVNYSACAAKCNNLIIELRSRGNSVLMLHRTPSLEAAKLLLQVGVMGYGNAMMKGHFINAAIDTIEEGMVWLYPELTSDLIKSIEANPQKNNDFILEKLTDREKEVALLLKDGESYNSIANTLNITARTVKAHALSCYAKLGVHDRVGFTLLFK
ncbi:LuxR C-terminal-related transcriptional regulator [Sulfurimonas sp.]|uniref:response regulator transcription factor n=1 Tax=Sulfurimonas sp. TaxID=2022749 RepID=UPI003D1393E8